MLSLFCLRALPQQADTLLIHFDFDKDEINADAATVLDNYFTAGRMPRITAIALYGHCDSVGGHAYNDALSRRRVQSTLQYLTGKGLPAAAFTLQEGLGKRRPLNGNNTAAQRLQNRRVEVIVQWKADTPVVAQPLPPPAQKDTPVSLTDIIRDTTLPTGRTIVLRNLQFEPGRHMLLPSSRPVLEELYKVMLDNPTLVIQIEGHVCCTPDNEDGYDLDDRTYDLSVKRARAVYRYLTERNIAIARLSYTGFGGSRKLYQLERNEFERQENRRVEIKVVRR